MDSITKVKDSNCNIPTPSIFGHSHISASTITLVGQPNIGYSECFSFGPPPHHDLASVNSIDLNAATSLSDDSGVPLTANSSISSGDSCRLGLYKYEVEIIESDGEVSQFDSLDNCSEGGMSAENFNTLKKGPLAPIEPPPEFQDSPHDTLVSRNPKIMQNLRRWTSSQSSFEHLRDNEIFIQHQRSINDDCNKEVRYSLAHNYDEKTLKDSYLNNKPLYSSDSILINNTNNIYDEPNNITSNSTSNCIDTVDINRSLTASPVTPALIKVKQSICPYYQDHTKYFKAIPSEQDHIMIGKKCIPLGLSDISAYDGYYGTKRNTYQIESNQRKAVCSPRNPTHYCHSRNYHTGINGCNNRPNSRNSLNSRLSSSHNSLSVSSTNKPDDSIFITQAMSHDALLTREISDFYNVPVDSDIYAFPIDTIQTGKENRMDKIEHNESNPDQQPCVFIEKSGTCKQSKINRRNNRNKRKKRMNNLENDTRSEKFKLHNNALKPKYKEPISLKNPENYDIHTSENSSQFLGNISQEPLHMTLAEVKQFYQSLYSDAASTQSSQNNQCVIKCSNETIWNESYEHSQSNLSSLRDKVVPNYKSKNSQSTNEDNDNINNNNINELAHNFENHNQLQEIHEVKSETCSGALGISNVKQTISSEKKSQFTLNLKQKFCNIFRFRRAQGRCQTNSLETEENLSSRRHPHNSEKSADERRKKFQSRALPPVPRKAEAILENCKQKINIAPPLRSFQFTSSIEKVKDYGWYWGPLTSEAAEKVLSNEPDGSFIVRDSSDDHYIFSLSFKLNNCVRHVRIEQDQGTFSFGSYAKFKSQTITEFIEKAVEHSRSGRYLFFLHRRPEHGPMRVQLTNPVSRFKHIQSLQHMCRFIILKAVIRKDLIQTLPLPRRLLDYLSYKHCYSEQVESENSQSQESATASADSFELVD